MLIEQLSTGDLVDIGKTEKIQSSATPCRSFGMISYRPCGHPCPWWCVSTGPNHIGRRCDQTGDRTRSDVQKYPQKSLEHEKMNNAFFRIWGVDPHRVHISYVHISYNIYIIHI